MSASATNSKTSPKSAKKSRVIVLQLSGDQLSRFPSSQPPSKSSSSAPSVKKDEPSPPAIQRPDSASTPAAAADKASDSNATPVPAAPSDQDPNSLAPPKPKRKGGWPAGKKRAPPAIDGNALPREKGRPGPKKKPRFRPDGTIDRNNEPGAAVKPASGIPAHKLGPKANTGAINAGLRALDRSGKPCRRWERKSFELKSFTGAAWSMSSWRSPQSNMRDEAKSDSTGSSEAGSGLPNGNGDKPVESSAVPSEDRSHSGVDANGDVTMTNAVESSPAPAIAAA
ncbi:DUF1711-domain-containing protein [Polychaeton citri CBS 116435]|uniref:DUF1711-domain-containing protein n=1 Tax=Polychaeton citri CBS 116435 TaxID=1314669 RepID=A0A9P4Q8D1_9PEZI|nr:DUF1711-domain-containing protein [Polychaeton citri CBS 116435]